MKTPKPVRAARGERTIEVVIHLYTNDLTKDQGKGAILPKHAWVRGRP